MPIDSKLTEEIDTTRLLGSLFEAYEEIAVMKMQKIRKSVLYTRDYMHQIGVVFWDTKDAYYKRVAKVQKKSIKDIIVKSKGTISILISPKDKFSGSIGSEVFESFYQDIISNKRDDIAIIGKIGKQMMSMRNKKQKYKYIDIKSLGSSKFDNFIKSLIEYSEIKVYFGKFINIIKQVSESTDLAQGAVSANKHGEPFPPETIFEPSIEHVLYFFESQLTKSLFKQCVAESELARLGSQINGMEQANQNSKDILNKLKLRFIDELKSFDNKKQLERMSGVSLWRIE